MMTQNSSASNALVRRSRKMTSSRPPTNTASAAFKTTAETSWRNRLVMASWSLVAISTASDSAMPSSNDQSRRRLMLRACGFGAARSQPRREFGHDVRALIVAQPQPALDFAERASAAEANPGGGIERAYFDARSSDGGHWSSGFQAARP